MPKLTSLRNRRAADGDAPKPLVAVWELTMKCDQACSHCGTRAGAARPSELATDEIIEVGQALVRLGCREVALIGGEAYLRDDIFEIVAQLAALGLRVVMQTGGRTLDAALAVRLRDAGMAAIGVSVDGPALAHDKLRGNLGSHRAAIGALDAAREAGLPVSANTQINKLNHLFLWETYRTLRAHGIESWQCQLTVPMGRAADRPEWLIDPWHIPAILETLHDIQLAGLEEPTPRGVPFQINCGNNLGYYGPYEAVLRSQPGGRIEHWSGCHAGRNVIGIESDGVVKGCPSLPTAPYTGGNVRDVTLDDIWNHTAELGFTRVDRSAELWGFCKTCYYADVCKAGCSWMAHCVSGRRGNNPFCYHRVVELEKRGLRERLVPAERAPNRPYDHGRFEILEEPIPPSVR